MICLSIVVNVRSIPEERLKIDDSRRYILLAVTSLRTPPPLPPYNKIVLGKRFDALSV